MPGSAAASAAPTRLQRASATSSAPASTLTRLSGKRILGARLIALVTAPKPRMLGDVPLLGFTSTHFRLVGRTNFSPVGQSSRSSLSESEPAPPLNVFSPLALITFVPCSASSPIVTFP